MKKAKQKVYPRVCGGSFTIPGPAPRSTGLSPRVRGKPAQQMQAITDCGSIPACAGEAATASTPAGWMTVYPRVCGGSAHETPQAAIKACLSPRVRGKPRTPAAGTPPGRSIPACAGEANAASRSSPVKQVYPRVCGGSSRNLG